MDAPSPQPKFFFVIMQFGGKNRPNNKFAKASPLAWVKLGSANVNTCRIFADITFNGEPTGSPLYGQHDCVFVCVCVAATTSGDDSKIQT